MLKALNKEDEIQTLNNKCVIQMKVVVQETKLIKAIHCTITQQKPQNPTQRDITHSGQRNSDAPQKNTTRI